ncbi:MAG: hypothetical protein AAFQ79_14470 [Pseudomonadota bacterium]
MIRTFLILALAFGMGLAATVFLLFENPGLIVGFGIICAFICTIIALATRNRDQDVAEG